MSDWLGYFCNAASIIINQAALVTSAGAQTRGTFKRKGLLWPTVYEGIPSITVEKHGSKSMGNPGYIASSSQEAGRQKLAFCCFLLRNMGPNPELLKPAKPLWARLHTHMQKCAPFTIPSPIKLTRNLNDRRVHSAFQIQEESQLSTPRTTATVSSRNTSLIQSEGVPGLLPYAKASLGNPSDPLRTSSWTGTNANHVYSPLKFWEHLKAKATAFCQ